MLSGFGPADHLSDLGIAVVHDLPGVGGGLQDHPSAVVSWPVTRGETWSDALSEGNRALYDDERRGPLASVGQASAFLRVTPGAPAPEIAVMPMLTYLLGESVPGFSCMVTVLSPRSRGTVRLASADPDDVPLVDPGYYTSPADLDLVGERAAELLRWTWTPGCGSPVGTPPARWSGLRASGPRTFPVGRASVLEGRVPSVRQAVSCR